MGGGLINIISNVNSDIYLTGNPEISFYKSVYRRHTRYGSEKVKVHFIDQLKFNSDSEVQLDNIGDVIHKGHLVFDLPSINIKKKDVCVSDPEIFLDNIQFDYDSLLIEFNTFIDVYLPIINNIIKIVYISSNSDNISFSNMINDINIFISQDNNIQLLNQFNIYINTKDQNDSEASMRGVFKEYKIDIFNIVQNIDVNKIYNDTLSCIENSGYQLSDNIICKDREINKLMKLFLLNHFESILTNINTVKDYLIQELNDALTIKNRFMSKNIKHAWIDNIGHSMIDYIDVNINGVNIDRHYGQWLNIWYQLTRNIEQDTLFNRMIGNISELTDFNFNRKPEYKLFIPLVFWFNNFSGLSFPIISLQYSDLRLNVKIRDINELIYIERIYKTQINNVEHIITANMISVLQKNNYTIQIIELVDDITIKNVVKLSKNLSGYLLFDIFYLDKIERTKLNILPAY